MPLISRRTFPPSGFYWFESKTNWPKNPKAYFAGKTFDEAVAEIVKHRLANPRFAAQWSTDPVVVGDELDRFTVLRLANDPNYCLGGAAASQGGASKKSALASMKAGASVVAAAAKKITAGVGVMIDWLGDGLKPVSQELANRRAEVCSTCPHNQAKDLTSVFTVPAAALIRKQIEIRNEMKLQTPFDAKLGVCGICACVLRLKPFVPIEHALRHLSPEVKSKLPEWCWMVKES